MNRYAKINERKIPEGFTEEDFVEYELVPYTKIYTVYVQLDEENRVIGIDSSDYVGDDWGIEIDRGEGKRYRLAASRYLEGGLKTEDGICRWKYVNGECVLRTAAEIEEDRANIPPVPANKIDVLRADVDFCLMMLEE